MKNKIKNMTYGIIGLGEFGYTLAVSLAKDGAQVIAVDKDEDKVKNIREYTENAIIVDSLDKQAFTDTGIANCDVAVVCIGQHIEPSILTTLNLIGMGIPKVIARATSPEHGEILERLGAEVVFPERDMALRLASRLENAQALDYISLSEKISISKVVIPDSFVGKTVLDLNLRSRFGVNIIAVENKGAVEQNIGPQYVFGADDMLYLAGNGNSINMVLDMFQK